MEALWKLGKKYKLEKQTGKKDLMAKNTQQK